jgi:choline dehydrogenase-like flavoprotein
VAGEEISRRSSYDYEIVGSGAGGANAGNLAKAARRVLFLEAGGDHENYNYQVPGFNGLVTEEEDPRWDYYVRHYASDERQCRDSKFVPDHDGAQYGPHRLSCREGVGAGKVRQYPGADKGVRQERGLGSPRVLYL